MNFVHWGRKNPGRARFFRSHFNPKQLPTRVEGGIVDIELARK